MKKFTSLVFAALLAGTAFAQDVTVGIERPRIDDGSGGIVYDTYDYWDPQSTACFNKSVEGLTASFYQSAAIEGTIVEDHNTAGGYEIKNVCHQGAQGYAVDYVWKLNCQDYDSSLKRHKNETLGSEGWEFGFDLTVAEGKTFTVSAIDFDLLVEQNPSYRIRILDATNSELYNSTWVTKTGGYNNQQWGAGSYCHIDKTGASFLFNKTDGEGNPINYQAIQYYPGFEGENHSVALPEAGLVLAAGTYRVVAQVDFNKDSSKAMSFDHFTLEGELSAATGIEAVTVVGSPVATDNAIYNLAGQRVFAPAKGQIYIKGGKKFIAK